MIGRVVHFKESELKCYAAIVTKHNGEFSINLVFVRDSSVGLVEWIQRSDVKYGDTIGTWHECLGCNVVG